MGQITHPTLGSPMAMVTPYAELVVTGSVININQSGACIPTCSIGYVSNLNSSTTPLIANGSFVGQWEDVKDYAIIYSSVRTDANSRDSGAYGFNLEFSQDKSGTDVWEEYYIASGTAGKIYSCQPSCRYFRINYINGATPQGLFRLQTTFKDNYGKPSSHRIDEPINDQNDAELTKSVITGKKASGEYTNFSATNNGNFKMSLEELENNLSVNSNTQLKTTLFDISGNQLASHLQTDGDYHLGVDLTQSVYVDSNNSSSTNILAGGSFVGSATSTLGVNSIQTSLKTDKNCTIKVQQSPDASNWDLMDTYNYYTGINNFGLTTQAINSYVRVIVNNLDTTGSTSYFRLQNVLCPMAEPLPRSLNANGRLKTSCAIVDEETSSRATVDALGNLRTITPIRLIGTSFDGTTKDPNFWTETITGTGSIVKQGELYLYTGSTANSTVTYETVRKSRKVTGAVNQFRSVARLSSNLNENNIRRIGAYDTNNGYFFQVNGSDFGLGIRKAGSDIIINSGSFNGNYGNSINMDLLTKRLTIDMSELSSRFFVNDVLLHTYSNPSSANTETLTLPVRMENLNFSGNTTDNSFEVKFATVLRLGDLVTNPQYKYIGTNATTVLKYGAGTLQRIINLDNAGTIGIYDAPASGTGLAIGIIDAAKTLGELEFNAPFSSGLSIVTAGNSKVTVIYE